MKDMKHVVTIAMHKGTADGIYVFYDTIMKGSGSTLLNLTDEQKAIITIIAQQQLSTIRTTMESQIDKEDLENIFLESFPEIVGNKE